MSISATAARRVTGTSLPTTAAAWSRRLSSGPQAIDARGEDGLDRRRHLDARGGPVEPVRAGLADEGARLHERPHALLEEERVALRPRDEERRERRGRWVGAEEGPEQRVGALRPSGSIRSWR